ILRKEFGFKGVLMTDWSAAHTTVKAALTGLDLEMGTDKKDYNEWYFANPLIKAVEEGKVPIAVVDEKVANVLRVMMNTKMIDEAVKVAKESEVVIIFGGLNHDFDTESSDKQNMDLPYGQDVLIQEVAKANPKTVVVIIAGSPVKLSGIVYRVPAVLWSWFG